MKNFKFSKYYLILLVLAIVIIPNLSMATSHTYDATEKLIFQGDLVYDFHLQVKTFMIELIGAILFVLILLDVIFNYKSFSKLLIPIISFIGLVVLSAFLSNYQDVVYDGVFQYYENVFVFISYGFFAIAASRIDFNKRNRRILRNAVYVSTILTFIQAFFQYFGINLFNFPGINRFIGILVGAISINLNSNTVPGVFGGLDNPNFVGSFIVIPIMLAHWSTLKDTKKFDWFILVISIWMLVASNSAAGGAGIFVLMILLGFVNSLSKESIVKTLLPYIVILPLNILFNQMSNKLIVFDKNQYLVIVLGIIAYVVISLVRFIFLKFHKKGLVASILVLVLLAVPVMVVSLDVLKDREAASSFSSYETDGSYLDLSKGDYKLRFTVKDSSLEIVELPSGINVEFFEETLDFSKTEHFKQFSGYYEIIDSQIAVRVKPMNLILLFVGDKILYQDIYGWREMTNVSEASSFGFEDYQMFASGRGYIWSRTLPLLKDRILMGDGPDSYMFVYAQEDFLGKLNAGFDQLMVIDKPHNLFMRYWVQFGFLALGLLLGVIAWISYKGLKLQVSTEWIIALLAVLGTGMFNDIIAGISFLMYIIIGVIISELSSSKNK